MNTPTQQFHWRSLAFVFLIPVTSAAIGALCASWLDREAASPVSPSDSETVAVATDPPASDLEEVRDHAWQRIERRLAEADERTQELTQRLILRIEGFFEGRKGKTKAFAEAALGWGAKWELIKSREGHREFIAEQFEEFVFSQNELAAFLEEASSEYAQGLLEVENKLFVAIRADLDTRTTEALPALANDDILRKHFDNIVAKLAIDIRHENQLELGRLAGSFVIGEAIAAAIKGTMLAVATRLGISGAIIGTGAATSWATLGAGFVISIAVESLLNWIIGWFHDPVEDISVRVASTLDDVKTSISSGDPEARRIHARIAKMAEADPDSTVRQRAGEVLASIENGGALGLEHTLARVAKVRAQARRDTLHQLVYEGVSE